MAEVEAGSSRGVFGVRFSGNSTAHLAGESISIQDEGSGFFRDGSFKCGFRGGIEEKVLAGFKVVSVVVGEDLETFLGSEFTDSPSPFRDSSGNLAEFVRIHSAPDVLEEMGAEVFSCSHEIKRRRGFERWLSKG